jgi:hypothetical protein
MLAYLEVLKGKQHFNVTLSWLFFLFFETI